VWEAVQPIIDRETESLINRYHALNERGSTVSDPRKIIPAAFHGQIRSLITRADVHIWGEYDPESSQIEVHDEQRVESKDLIEVAAVHTLLNGGSVYNLDPNQMPDGAKKMAAIKRYS